MYDKLFLSNKGIPVFSRLAGRIYISAADRIEKRGRNIFCGCLQWTLLLGERGGEGILPGIETLALATAGIAHAVKECTIGNYSNATDIS